MLIVLDAPAAIEAGKFPLRTKPGGNWRLERRRDEVPVLLMVKDWRGAAPPAATEPKSMAVVRLSPMTLLDWVTLICGAPAPVVTTKLRLASSTPFFAITRRQVPGLA